MSDYRDLNDPPLNSDPLRNPNDPLRRDRGYNARGMNATAGWIAAAVFIAIVLAVAFGIGHRPGEPVTNTASNDANPPATSQMAPPATLAPPAATPRPSSITPAPITPTPNSPAQRSQP
jgi:hypothetical protein